MKLKPPKYFCGMSVNGMYISVSDDGSIDVPDAKADDLMSHGFTPWKTVMEPKNIQSMSHAELVMHCMDMTRKTLEALPESELRARLMAVEPNTVVMPDDPAINLGINLDEVTEPEFDQMTKTQLYAFLRARGVVGKQNWSRDDLINLAKQNLRIDPVDSSDAA